jgi:hypothetical protein
LISNRTRSTFIRDKMAAIDELISDLRSLSTSRIGTPLATEPTGMAGPSEIQAPGDAPAGVVAGGQSQAEEEEKRKTAAEKWFNPNGPPVGSHMGARLLEADKDVWDHNAWYV